MKGKLFRDLFATSAQVMINQASSLIIFLITSTYLLKPVYGEFNWCVAVITVFVSVMGFGMEPIIVKRIAAGGDIRETTGLFIQHTLLSTFFFLLMLLVVYLFAPTFLQVHAALMLLSVSFLLTYLSSPFKQLANGKQWFQALAYMASIANVTRAISLLIFAFAGHFTIEAVLYIYVASSVAEFIISAWLMLRKTNLPLLKLTWNRRNYIALVRESLPQLGIMLFNISLARFDWILLGIMTTAVVTADYSFTYKVFELCAVPLLIIAPLLLPRFTRYFSNQDQEDLDKKKKELLIIIRLQIVIACFIALMLNLCWVPVIDAITDNKYGAVNSTTILLLSCSMPFLYVNNFLWTIHFAQGHLKVILAVIAVIFSVNIIGDLIFIPLLQAKGAALAYSMAIIVQTFMYMRKTNFAGLTEIWPSLIICSISAVLSGSISLAVSGYHWWIIPLAAILFIGLLLLGRQITRGDWAFIKKAFGI